MLLQEEVKTNVLSKQMAKGWLLSILSTRMTSSNTFFQRTQGEHPYVHPDPPVPMSPTTGALGER